MNNTGEIGAGTLSIFTPNENDNSSYWKKINELKTMAENFSKVTEETPEAGNKQILDSLIKLCEMMNNSLYSARSWNNLMKVYGKAKKLSLSDNPSTKDLRKAVQELNAALAALENAEKVNAEEDDESKLGLPLIMKMDSGGKQSASPEAAAESSVTVSTGGLDLSV